MQIPGLRGMSPVTLAKNAIVSFIEDDMLTHAYAMSYQIIFSFFPFIIFLIALLGFLNVPEFFNWLLAQAAEVLPEQGMAMVTRVIRRLQQPQGGLLSFGVALALWTASSGTRALMNALNVAFKVRETRPIWKRYPLSMIYTIGIAAMLVVATVFLLIGPQAIAWLAAKVGLQHFFVLLWTWIRLPIVLVLMSLAVAVIYHVAPDIKHRFRFFSPGAVIAVVAWVISSLVFDYYVKNFANYNAMYGGIGTIIMLLFYFSISAAMLLLGAEVNAVIARHVEEQEEKGNASAQRVQEVRS
jgi:membrane protein